MFVGSFVGINPEKLNSNSYVGREINSLGVIAHGHMHKPRACQRHRYKPRTCQLRLTLDKLTGWLASLDLRRLLLRISECHHIFRP